MRLFCAAHFHINQQSVSGLLATTSLLLATNLAFAELPTGYSVESGSASFQTDIQPAGSTLTITASNKAIINYSTFNIGQGNTVNIISPISLHRVTGGSPSQILGTLNSTGKVFLVNPVGIFFGSTSQVNVGSLVASTHDIRSEDFLAGNYAFNLNGSLAGIHNAGNISAANQLAFVTSQITNTGNLNSPFTNLSVGEQVHLNLDPAIGLEVTVTESLKQEIADIQSAILNSGNIEGNQIQLQAKLGTAIYERAVNNEGRVKATTTVERDGVIELIGTSEDLHAEVWQSGTLDASNDSGVGGTIHVLGDNVAINDNALVNASGQNGGALFSSAAINAVKMLPSTMPNLPILATEP